MSASTLVSRLTGFLRTWAMGYALGLTALADSYDIANNLPNMLFELLAGGVLASVFIPLFMERMKKQGEEDAWRFASYVLNIIVIVLGAIALVATVWPEPFVRSQTMTVPAEQARLAIWLFRFFAIQIVFYGMGLVFTGVLNSYRHFLAPAVAPIFNNLVVTVTLLGFYVPFRETDPQLAMTGLAVGTTLGVIVMAAVQIPSLLKLGGRYTPRIDWSHPGIRNIGAKMVPILVYVVTNMVGLTFRTNFAISTGEGGQAALRYAWQFYQLPYGIFAVALATAIFPELADRATGQDMSGFKNIFARGLRATMVLIVPLAALLATLSTPVITLYRAGRFTAEDVPVVAGVLMWWALGLTFFAGYMFVLKSFYSLQDTKTPMYTNIAATTIHIGLYAILTRGLGQWTGLGIIGIPIADGVFFFFHMLVLVLILRQRIGLLEGRSLASTLAKVVLASASGAFLAWTIMQLTSGLAAIGGGFLVQLLAAGTLGLCTAYAVMAITRVPELTMITSRMIDFVQKKRNRK
ncbi:MAG: murein biosynthesis integral membrane protein MurJ [Coriobacteriia bacterium]|nr:murein biosynthesis integral membrane protein MurJ [Coriobacteriia bacterium]